MHFLQHLMTAAVAAIQLSSPIRSQPLYVRAVLDGDTIDVAEVGRVRLLGIDAPEVSHGFDTAEPFGAEAREKLASLVLHHWIRLEQDGPDLDSYNRHLAYVIREDEIFVNAAMVREGLARVSARSPLRRLGELKDAEAEAQRLRHGMWGGRAASTGRPGARAGRKRPPRAKVPPGARSHAPRRSPKAPESNARENGKPLL